MRRRVQQWKERLYDRRSGWMDGTTQFAHLIRKHLSPHMRLLDLGAGAGKARSVNFRHEVAEVVGIDPDPAITRNGNVDRRVLGIAESLPFRAESFHLVFTDWVVEHLANPLDMAAEVFRVLKPDGYFIFRTGNLRHYSYAVAAHTPHWFHQLVANPGVAVQLVLKPPIWSRNKISGLADIVVDYCRKINHLMRFFPLGAVAPLGTAFHSNSSLGKRDIKRPWTETVLIMLSKRHSWRGKDDIARNHRKSLSLLKNWT